MSAEAAKPRVIFSVTNCICFDQRVMKIAETVRKLDCDITIIGRKLGDCCDSGSVPFKTKRFSMFFKRGFLFYKFFNIRLFFYLLCHKYDLLVSNDLDTLIPNFLVSKLKRLPLVFDSHEYFTGLPELNERPFVKSVWKTIEKRILPHLKSVMTVSDSIAGLYENEYNIQPLSVRNCSVSSEGIAAYSRKELGLSEDHILLIFQGGGINIDKGGEELVDAVSITEGVSLLIAGSGDVLPVLKQKVSVLNIGDRVKFVSKVPWEELMRYTKSADAGMCLEKDTNLNYRFSLPNKLFDYISAGLPVIAGNLPEISKLILANECGIIIPAITPGEIQKAIVRLRDDRALMNKLKENSVIASENLNWEKESLKVVEFYKRVLNERVH